MQPDQNQIDKMSLVTQLANHFLDNVSKVLKDSREKSLAITKLEECLMWAQQCILRYPDSAIQIVPGNAIKQ
jgi:hypothetical protein